MTIRSFTSRKNADIVIMGFDIGKISMKYYGIYRPRYYLLLVPLSFYFIFNPELVYKLALRSYLGNGVSKNVCVIEWHGNNFE